MPAWTTEIEIAYDFGHLYVLDGAGALERRRPHGWICGCRTWASSACRCAIEGYGAKPALDLDGWEHVAEFSLRVASGSLAFASGSVRRGAGSGSRTAPTARAGAAARTATYRLPAVARARRRRRARSSSARPAPVSDLGDIPALLHDEGVQAVGSVVGTRVRGDALQLYVQL